MGQRCGRYRPVGFDGSSVSRRKSEMNEYENLRRVIYPEPKEEIGDAVFVPICPICGRFVKADDTIEINDSGLRSAPNATCKKCGRVQMPFEGFY